MSGNQVLLERLAPQPLTTAASVTEVEHLCASGDEGAPDLLAVITECAQAKTLLAGLSAGSPFLWRLVVRDPGRAARLLTCVPEEHIITLCDAARAIGAMEAEPEAMRTFRRLRAESALLIAFCDLGGVWNVDQVVEALSEFADACVQGAFAFALRVQIGRGQLSPADPDHPDRDLGMFILALGKHGARELNYSSDIDLTVFFDPEAAAFAPARDAQDLAIRMIKTLVKLLSERNAEGYVHRVDLRLRPDPGSTPIVMPVNAALTYYETVGQNWERAAMLKARTVAGDIRAGEAFLKELTPFIWRKYFDYAAIADIHAMKRQIYAVKGHETIAILGHDVKVGRGGIREIEFFVQTQQLVYGGRRPILRGRRTLDMLVVLCEDGWISQSAETDMAEAYRFLRGIEHRIQMIADEQTQRLPAHDDEMNRFAAFCGYSREGFEAALTRRLLAVEAHYARLFEATPGLASSAGSLVFTGVEDDPETLETLRRLGFQKPALAAETVRGWHFGRRTAVTTQRARETLTELVPALLESFGNSSDPDAALAAFDTALGKLPAAVELFSILKNHPGVRGLFSEILGSAPRLADVVTRAPHVLDIVVDSGFTRVFDVTEIEARAGQTLARETDFEVFLEQSRVMARHELFLVATQVLSGVLPPLEAGRAHAAVAEAFLRIVLARTAAELAEKHGTVPGATVTILGYGKLGSQEMTATSDLDLVIVYDSAPDDMSDGKRPLFASEWFARLMQRLISALSTQMRNGALYEIDVRLRPSGRKGPVAVSASSFESYQASEAETWEHMALTRARPVAGDAVLQHKLMTVIRTMIARPRDAKKTAQEIATMRALIAQEKAPDGKFDIKMMPGGLVDIEFIAQYLILVNAHAHPDIVGQGTLLAIRAAAVLGVIEPEDADTLTEAYGLYSKLSQFLRIVLVNDHAVEEQPPSFRLKLAQACGLPAYKLLLSEMERHARAVRRLFVKIVGPVKA